MRLHYTLEFSIHVLNISFTKVYFLGEVDIFLTLFMFYPKRLY